MYHITFKTRLQKIKKEGITLGHRRNWSTPLGIKLGDKNRIYFISRFDEAIRWAHRMEWETKKEIVIIEINTPKVIEQDNNTGAIIGIWLKTPNKILVNDIKKVIPLTLELIRKLIAKQI